MKKILLVLLVFGVIFSCGKKEEPQTENVETKTETTAEPTKEGEASDAGATYTNPEVQKYVNDYKVLIKEYTAAVNAKDETKIAELEDKIHELTTKEAEISVKITDAEEVTKFSDEISKLDDEADALADKE